ncbi:MAG: hypothetical protein IPN07_05600 [Dehalococcoidia bacterium]|nr:hypothetical protein [Dehalococcoidia bacterium]
MASTISETKARAPNSLVFDFDLHAGKADRAVLTDRDRRLVDGNLS